ncbi:MAG: 4Fe-4S binding protein, partial [Planctomycetota bacterium]
MTGKPRILAVLCLLSVLSTGSAFGAERFPHPTFESDYVIPTSQHPDARDPRWGIVDVVVLLASLLLAAILALVWRWRRGIFLLTLFSLVYFGFFRNGCVCAVGALQNVMLALFDSTYAVPLTVLAFFFLPLLFTLLFGRVFCAAVCPLGAAQDVVIFRPLKVPAWLNQVLGMLAYVYLGLVVLFVATGTGFLICQYDPFVSFFRLSGSAFLLALGGGFLLLGTVVARPYCRYLCPLGVLLNWLSRLSQWHSRITPDDCIECRLCEDACPFGAIRKPTPEGESPRLARGIQRLAILLILLPVLV